ncbi:UNVERIFIED_CONTAM: hypothetical protein Sradi_7138500 [Sesamum radiatum]|uniref:J domain-containing protein n=1 Tax=Sesamum radiatum TaxID=300843 RepID=A0AAW2IXC9_SESRA
MATPGQQTPAHNQTSISSVKSTLRAYYVPLLFLTAALFCQLVVLPRNFPPTHYDVLGIPMYSSIEEVTWAYEKITSKWNSSVEVPPAVDFIKVRYAFELLTDQFLKRDYDIFNIDEHFHILEKVEEHYSGKHISEIDLPLIKAASFDPADQDYRFINSQNFLSMLEDDKALLLQVISSGSNRCAQFSTTWKRIGLPVVLAFPPGCKSSSCLTRCITFWQRVNLIRFGVESAPAIVFLKDPGVAPVVYQVLPQLRNVTSMELGCDVHGYSRAGSDTKIWYCALIAGRPSQELNEMRERYCFFHIHSQDSYETCGPRKSPTDAPRLFIVRYERNPNSEKVDTSKQANNVFHSLFHTEVDPVSTLVAKYNGSSEISEKTRAPELVPEDGDQIWSKNSNSLISSGRNMREWISGFISSIPDHLSDPKIGPSLMLVALMSSGLIYLNRTRSTKPGNKNEPNQEKNENKPGRRSRRRKASNQLIPPSITDVEPKDAKQIPLLSDSESE